jgi:hypothetical protein
MANVLQCPACGYIQENRKGNIHYTSKLTGNHSYYQCKNPKCTFKSTSKFPLAIFVDYDKDMQYKTSKGKDYMIFAASRNPAIGKQTALEDKTGEQQSIGTVMGTNPTAAQGKDTNPFQFPQQPQGRRKRPEALLDTFFRLLSVRKGSGYGSKVPSRTILECRKCGDTISDHSNTKLLKKAKQHIKKCY